MNLTFESDRYEAYLGSAGVKITCLGTNMTPADIVWIVYMLNNPTTQQVIFSDNNYIGNSSRKYSIESKQLSDTVLSSSLTIFNIQPSDILKGYECVCNIYKKCSNTNHAFANTSLVQVELTTIPSNSYFNKWIRFIRKNLI